MMPVVGLVTAVVVAALALVVAVLAGLLSREAWRPGDVLVPWGLGLAIGGSVSLVVLARLLARTLGFAAAGGWLVGLLGLLSGRPEGDYVIASDPLGVVFMVAATVAVLIAAMWRVPSQANSS